MTPVEALQATLGPSTRRPHVYAVLGGRVSVSEDPEVAGPAPHRLRHPPGPARPAPRRPRRRGRDPVAAAPAYDVPARTRDARRLLEVAATTEERCAEAYAQQVASTSGDDRAWAVDALRDAAVRLLALGGAPSAWPGLREL